MTYAAGGWAFTLILLAFFGPSVALSRIGRARKKQLVDIGKGGARDALQVFANGGVATACAALAGLTIRLADEGSQTSRPGSTRLAWIAAFAGSYAAATADTWGTEIGTLMRGGPRSILTLRPMATGLSGGVTFAGTAAEVGGAAWIALAAALCLRLMPAWGANASRATLRSIALPVWSGGVAGALADSLLGATVQELRHCPVCERTCETDPHICGSSTRLVRGLPGFTNDAVNFAATAIGAALSFRLARRSGVDVE